MAKSQAEGKQGGWESGRPPPQSAPKTTSSTSGTPGTGSAGSTSATKISSEAEKVVGSGPEASKRGRVQAGPHSGAQRVGQAFGDKRSSACTPGNNWARGTTTTNASSAAKLGDTPTVRSLLTWNLHGLNGAKLLALTSKVNDIKPDVIIASETELALGDSPAIQGYSTLMPTVSSSTRVRVVMFIRKNLQAVQLSTPEDVPIVAAEIGSEAVIGLYRQFTPVSYTHLTLPTKA